MEISQERYENLCQKENKLIALEAAGVDNWEGYDFAMDLLEDMKEGIEDGK